MLFLGAIAIARVNNAGLFAIGATSLMLLLIGIHNAWDSIAYIATDQ